MSKSRIIKKYPNRRLYDTALSRYVTVADVKSLVMDSVDFKVVDASSNEDITRTTLLQIIMDQEASNEPLFTTEILSKMIRFYGDSVQGVFSSYLDKSLRLFVEQQERLQRQMSDMITGGNPMDMVTDLTQRNLEIWRDMQRNFLKASGWQVDSSTKKSSSDKDEQDKD